jgi:hypothetical protein
MKIEHSPKKGEKKKRKKLSRAGFDYVSPLHSECLCPRFCCAHLRTHRAMCESVYCRSKTDKRILYVGGLDEDVDLAVLRAAFIPFGEVN